MHLKKYIRANYSKSVSKDLKKAIMLRTTLRKKFLKVKTFETRIKYNKQRNICECRKTKRNYYENLDLNDIIDHANLWATVKPLFPGKW